MAARWVAVVDPDSAAAEAGCPVRDLGLASVVDSTARPRASELFGDLESSAEAVGRAGDRVAAALVVVGAEVVVPAVAAGLVVAVVADVLDFEGLGGLVAPSVGPSGPAAAGVAGGSSDRDDQADYLDACGYEPVAGQPVVEPMLFDGRCIGHVENFDVAPVERDAAVGDAEA